MQLTATEDAALRAHVYLCGGDEVIGLPFRDRSISDGLVVLERAGLLCCIVANEAIVYFMKSDALRGRGFHLMLKMLYELRDTVNEAFGLPEQFDPNL